MWYSLFDKFFKLYSFKLEIICIIQQTSLVFFNILIWFTFKLFRIFWSFIWLLKNDVITLTKVCCLLKLFSNYCNYLKIFELVWASLNHHIPRISLITRNTIRSVETTVITHTPPRRNMQIWTLFFYILPIIWPQRWYSFVLPFGRYLGRGTPFKRYIDRPSHCSRFRNTYVSAGFIQPTSKISHWVKLLYYLSMTTSCKASAS